MTDKIDSSFSTTKLIDYRFPQPTVICFLSQEMANNYTVRFPYGYAQMCFEKNDCCNFASVTHGNETKNYDAGKPPKKIQPVVRESFNSTT